MGGIYMYMYMYMYMYIYTYTVPSMQCKGRTGGYSGLLKELTLQQVMGCEIHHFTHCH